MRKKCPGLKVRFPFQRDPTLFDAKRLKLELKLNQQVCKTKFNCMSDTFGTNLSRRSWSECSESPLFSYLLSPNA